MTPQQAKKVLVAMMSGTHAEFSMTETHLHCMIPYISITAGRAASLDSDDFTADQLEAIATWMRDPHGVAV